ncbi:MAG: hypothetical protein RLZ35_66 [Pseudomonadota bacterium]
MKTEKDDIVKLHGTIERVTYHNADNGFCVLQVKLPKQKDLTTVVGASPSPTAGEYIDCTGTWVQSGEYGRQFRAASIKTILPDTLAGIEKFLSSGFIKGIGPGYAKRLVDEFGTDIFDVIEYTPERLQQVPGLGKSRRESIVRSWVDQKFVREIMVFLQSHGVGTARAVRIYKTYGQNAIAMVKENPYRLAQDIHGIGFKIADALATRLGIDKHALPRAQAGLSYLLQEMASGGDCAMPALTLVEKTASLLDIPKPIVEQAVIEALKEKRIVFDYIENNPCIFLQHYHRAEIAIARQLKDLSDHPLPFKEPLDMTRAIPWVEEKNAIVLSVSQKKALAVALNNKVTILTGGPGVGKTTLVNSILTILRSQTGKVMLGAPTGRAAKRLSESTGHEAKTLHRLLEFDPKNAQFKRNKDNPLPADWIIIDEVSMIDVLLMHHLLKAVPMTAGILLVGDVDQLPSVSAGAVLANLIDSGQLATVKLTEIFRQAATSAIVQNAHRINMGKMPSQLPPKEVLSDFYYMPCENAEAILQKLLAVVTERIPKRFGLNPIQEIQILTPMNRGTLGVRHLNALLQTALNPNPEKQVTRFGQRFGIGDKVIQTVNNYDKEVFNGDIGFITAIQQEEGLVSIQFDLKTVVYELDDLDEVNLAYATSIHKAQGSEYPAVVMPLSTQHYTLLERNLLYTGVTRAKKLMVLLGETKAVHMAVNQTRAHQRITNLATQLRRHLGPCQSTQANRVISEAEIRRCFAEGETAQMKGDMVD